MKQQTINSQLVVHHRVRTFFAAVLGSLTLTLIFACILVVWANRTLTDTNTYVQTVTPLVSQKEVQDFVANRVADQVLGSAPADEVAKALLTQNEIAGKTAAQLTPLVRTVITDNVQEVMASPGFAKLWKDTNRSAHAQLISQLNSNSSTITLNLTPAINGALDILRQTKLSPISDKIELPAAAGTFSLKGGSIDKVHTYYHWFQQGTLGLIVLTLLLTGLTIWVSVHHLKTTRRILIGTALSAFVMAAIIQSASIIPIQGADPASLAAARAIAHVLFHNLQLTCLIVGAVGLVLGIGSEIYEHKQRPH